MGLSASMWTSVSGLLNFGQKMSVVGNNIANINTLAFKAQRMDFQDFIYQSGYSAAGPTQLGRGVSINALSGDFKEGSLESTGNSVHLAIQGNGYFQVRDEYSDQVWYTRAGNFRFSQDGYYTTPGGKRVQGWKIDNSDSPSLATGSASGGTQSKSAIRGTGVPVDVLLDTRNVPPKQTTKVKMDLNLTSTGTDRTQDSTDPFFALSKRWNGRQPATPKGARPLAQSAYEYPNPIKVYDEAGNAHTLTTYFDPVTSGAPALSEALAIPASAAQALAAGKPLFGADGVVGNKTYQQVLDEINDAIGRTATSAPPRLTALPIKQLPSGAWHFDLDAAISATGTGSTTTITAAEKTTILNGALLPATAVAAANAATEAGTKAIFGAKGVINGKTYTAVLQDVNTALGLPSAGQPPTPALTALPIRKLPSGAWRLDLDAAETANIITAAQKATILADAKTQDYGAFGPVSQADPKDINPTKNYASFGPVSKADPKDLAKTLQNLPSGYRVYEYLVTMDPAEDKRTFGGVYDPVTGILRDGTPKLANPTSFNATGARAAAGKNTLFGSGAPGNGKTYQEAWDAVNTALGGNLTQDVGILRLPSGAWVLDPGDPNVAAALATNAPLDPSYTMFGAAADAKPLDDVNRVKKFSETASGGILMRGTIIFNSNGDIVNHAAYSYMGNTGSGDDNVYWQNPDDLKNWEPTPMSSNGLPVVVPNFTGHPMANGVRQTVSNDKPKGEDYLVEIDFGFRANGDLDAPWTNTKNAATVGTDYSMLALLTSGEKGDNPTTSRNGSSVSRDSSQDGYESGELLNVSVNKDGVLEGIYSNNVILPLYQLSLYAFVNQQGLRREGNNLFSATRTSGNPRVGPANQNGMGEITSHHVEQSNVDMAREIVNMMQTQRGFNANSKGITTADQMMETVVGMKR